MITIYGFPLFFMALQKFAKSGLCFLATTAGKYIAFLNLLEPSLDNLAFSLTEDPEVLCLGN